MRLVAEESFWNKSRLTSIILTSLLEKTSDTGMMYWINSSPAQDF